MDVWDLLLSHYSSGEVGDEDPFSLGRSFEYSFHFLRKHFSPQVTCILRILRCLTLPSKGASGEKSHCGVRIPDFEY